MNAIESREAEFDSQIAAKKERKSRTQTIQIEQHGLAGMLWFVGWLFTIGFLHLPFWKAILGLFIWPYYLGASFTV